MSNFCMYKQYFTQIWYIWFFIPFRSKCVLKYETIQRDEVTKNVFATITATKFF